MKKKFYLTVLLTGMAFFFLGSALWGQSPELKKSMEARRPAVDALLAKGAAGENNQGFLTVRGKVTPPEQKTVDGENRDRQQVYQAIAGKTGQPVAEVGRQRAAQIAQRAKSGVWLQDAKGNWYQKK